MSKAARSPPWSGCASDLARAYEGRPYPVAADRAMADLVRRYAIPRAVPEALLEGLAWDAEGRRYETLDELFDYAARVAGTVGVMMTLMMGVREPQTLARACDLGIAMQLTNIARDVGEDARAGRLYLPLCWLREAGVDPEALLARRLLQRRSSRVSFDGCYAKPTRSIRARGAGIAQLPLSCRPAHSRRCAALRRDRPRTRRCAARSTRSRIARASAARRKLALRREGHHARRRWLSGGAPRRRSTPRCF